MLKFFTENTKLADAIASHPSLIQLLPRFNISLGFGDKKIGEICETFNVPTNLFLIVCNIYSSDSYRPSLQEISNTDIVHLVSYLKESHKYYFESRIPHIENHLRIITEQIDSKSGTILSKFFIQYKKELKEHFDFEEFTIFPLLNDLWNNQTIEYEFNGFDEAHTNIEDTLNDLIQIIFKYIPNNTKQENTIGMAFDILQLAEDLKKHALIEEYLLVPLFEHLERRSLK